MNAPNIILIMADQLAAQALSLYGNRVCKTPNLDRLASKGVVFENAYCNNPLCVPSRASMFSGLHSPRIAVYDNANELPCSQPTMAHYLRHAGYWTELCGKMHFIGADQLHGFNQRTVTDVYPSDYRWIADWDAGPSFVPSGTSLNGVVEAGKSIRTMQEDYDDEVEHRAVQSIYELARQPDKQPFFQLISFTNPHTPFTVNIDCWNRYSHDEIDMPTVGEIAFEELDYHSRALYFAHGRHRHRITSEHIRNSRHAYYGMISYLDDKIGRILDVLDNVGFSENTVVIFTSDHGEMLGERGMWFKQAFWEWAARVPLIIRMPGKARQGKIRTVTSLVDLLPSFLDMAKHRDLVPAEAAGTSLLPLIQGETTSHPDIAISDYLGIGPCVPCRMIRSGRFKLMRTHGHPDLLFDLEADPNELTNLANDPQHDETIAHLHALSDKDWNTDRLDKQVRASQKQRKIIKNTPGTADQWDYIARIGDDSRYVRTDGVDSTKSRLRFPQVPGIAPDWPELEKEIIADLIAGKRILSDFIR